MIKEYLKRRCLSLPRESRRELVDVLVQSLEKPEIDKGPVLEGIWEAALREYGVDIILARERSQPVANCRMVAGCLAQELLPISQSEVARWLGVRPCTVNYYGKMMRAALGNPAMDPRLVEVYDRIKNHYNHGKDNA